MPQVDGEPWMQPAAELRVTLRNKGLVLKRLPSSGPAARMATLVLQALDTGVQQGAITDGQRQFLSTDIMARLEQGM